MANYANLKAAVNAAITTNGNNEITGAILNDILNSIISTIGGNYTFAGVVTPSTTISAPDANVFWIGGAGTYTQFGGTITIAEGNIGVYTYNGSYTRNEIVIAPDTLATTPQELTDKEKWQVQNNIGLPVGAIWEMGNITISANGWSYSNSSTRVRTVKDSWVTCKAGWKVGFNTFSGKRMYIGWRRPNGTYGLQGWLTSEFTLTEDGEYVFLLSLVPESSTTVEALTSDFYIKTEVDIMADVANNISNIVDELSDEVENASLLNEWIPNYISEMLGAQQTRLIKTTTGGIYNTGVGVKQGESIRIMFSFVSSSVKVYGITDSGTELIATYYSTGPKDITAANDYKYIGIQFPSGLTNQYYYIGSSCDRGYIELLKSVALNLPHNEDSEFTYTSGQKINSNNFSIDTSATTYKTSSPKYVKQGEIIHVYSSGNRYIPIAECSSDSSLLRILVAEYQTSNSYHDYYYIAERDMYVVVGGLSSGFSAEILTVKVLLERGYTKGISHRGYNTVAPENTIPAFKLAIEHGFMFLETDIQFTSDGVAVLLHDSTINRTARNSDGTEISETININDITYAQALTYDFGIWKGAEYAGTKIPTLAEFVTLCRNKGVGMYLEPKNSSGIATLASIVRGYGMQKYCTWIGAVSTLSAVKAIFSDARLGLVKANALVQSDIDEVISLRTECNEVFMDGQYVTSHLADDIELCKQSGVPLELWTVSTASDIAQLDSYISGATSNLEDASQILKNI